jgi:urea transport system ATP-binding protein
MLSVRNLNHYYGSSHTLRDVNFEVPAGACTVLLGRNGVGKSTLLKCLMGVLRARSGSVWFDNKDVTSWAPHKRVAQGIAYVPQGREIFARLTVEENLQMGLARLQNGASRTISGEVFELFPVLKQMRGRRGGDLSGGQQQQLAIARALVSRPKLLILDEPTEGIQPSIIKDIEAVIATLAARGDMAILLVEQYYDFAERLADHFVVMSRGEVIKHGLGREMGPHNVRSYLAL